MNSPTHSKRRTRLLFDDLPNTKPLLRRAHMQDYAVEETIFGRGDPSEYLFVIEHGQVEFFLPASTGSHAQLDLDVQGPGEYFGEIGLLAGRARSACAVARHPTRCKLIPAEDVLAWLREHPNAQMALLRHASIRIIDLSEELQTAQCSAYERVVRYIEQNARFDEQSTRRVVRSVPTIKELAKLLDISREWTGRIRKDLIARGFVKWIGATIEVLREPLPNGSAPTDPPPPPPFDPSPAKERRVERAIVHVRRRGFTLDRRRRS